MKKTLKTLTTTLLLTPLVLACFAFSLMAHAESDVSPPPDGGYPGFTTAEGHQALKNLTSGIGNSAFGWRSLFSVTTASYNTGLGGGTLALNIADANTATGVASLILNTTGTRNTANGAAAMVFNGDGHDNAAVGYFSLYNNTSGNSNSGLGTDTLISNTTGDCNIALGESALLNSTTGDNNIGIGCDAGSSITTGSNNIYIGNSGSSSGEGAKIRIGTVGTQTATFIAGISGVAVAGGVTVVVDTNGQLGTVTSSARFKDEIKPMDKASEAILALQPVTFRYKHELDPDGIPQFGLVAEQVEKVNPDLVARDAEGKVYTVRYEAVNAMLLNEFLKEHRKVEEQDRRAKEEEATISRLKSADAKEEATIARQQKEIEALSASLKEQAVQIQKVSAQLAAKKAAPRLVVNDR